MREEREREREGGEERAGGVEGGKRPREGGKEEMKRKKIIMYIVLYMYTCALSHGSSHMTIS